MRNPTNAVVRLLSLNCYLVPNLFTFRAVNSTCRFQDERAKLISRYIVNKDVIALQEVWGGQLQSISHGIRQSHDVLPLAGWQLPVWNSNFSKWIEPMYVWLNKTGGLWIAKRNNIPLLYRSKSTFANSQSWSFKGVEVSLLDMDNYWPGKFLLLFNTHLDPTHELNKQKQIQQIRQFVDTTLNHLVQEPSNFPGNFGLQHTAVVVVGDFNTSSSSPQYLDLLSTLEVRDLYKEHLLETNQEEEFSYEQDNSLFVAHELNHSRRIDYIFAMDQFTSPLLGNVKLLPLKCVNFTIERQPKNEELSDHWPLTAFITVKE